MNYDETNRGAIWKNDNKEKETHPDFKGSVNVDGREYWVAAWRRADGASPSSPALKFSIQPKEDQQQPQSAPVTNTQEEDVPF